VGIRLCLKTKTKTSYNKADKSKIASAIMVVKWWNGSGVWGGGVGGGRNVWDGWVEVASALIE
jgi:hypothetical protein